MKKQIFLLAVLVVYVIIAQAKILTVNNNTVDPNSFSPGQFTNLQVAINSANAGDTIYVSGSSLSYGSVGITKQLTIIGAGYYLPDNQFQFQTRLHAIALHPNSSGSRFIGLYIESAGSSLSAVTYLDNILVERCFTNGFVSMSPGSSDWIIRNNIIAGIGIYFTENVLIANNVITNRIVNSDKSTVIVTNNILLSPNAPLDGVSNALFTNNIFFNTQPQTCSFCTFNNNISFPASPFLYGTNMGGGNLEGADPQFTTIVFPNSFSFSNDYTLLPTSPAIGAGTDGTDIGISGGLFPFDVINSGIPAIPQITHMEILNSNIPQNDVLNIHIKAQKQD